MNIIKALVDRYNHKKCARMWQQVHNNRDLLRSQNEIIISVSTLKGYDEFFRKLSESDYEWRVDDSMRDAIFIIIKMKKK